MSIALLRTPGTVYDWRDLARCAEADPDIFTPGQDDSVWPAKNICASCEVQADCLIWALDHGEPHSIWGGLTEQERKALGPDPSPEQIRAALKNAGKKTCTQCGVPKILDDFPRDGENGWRANCKECRNGIAREKRKAA